MPGPHCDGGSISVHDDDGTTSERNIPGKKGTMGGRVGKKIILCLYRDRGRVTRNETAKFMTLPKRRKKESSKQPVSSSRRRRTSSVFARYSVFLFLFSWRPVLFIYFYIYPLASDKARSAERRHKWGARKAKCRIEKNRQTLGSYNFIAYETYVHPDIVIRVDQCWLIWKK